MPLTLDRETHEYRLDGRVLPSVTQVVRAMVPGWRADPWYLQRGRAVHEAIRLHLAGTLDEPAWTAELVLKLSLEESGAILGRVQAAIRFLRETGAEIVATELPVHSDAYRFAGTLDLLARIGRHLTVIDWKGTIDPAGELQLAGYSLGCAILKSNDFTPVTSGILVELHDDGSYRTKAVNLRAAEKCFLACLTLYNWRKEHNVD